MLFNPNNKIVQMCAEGMEHEAAGRQNEALLIFTKAWQEAENDLEKFTAAHYVARQQESIDGKLEWDKKALEHALKIESTEIKGSFPSLYLNIGKCYEDLGKYEQASENYQLALSFTDFLHDNGYGRMIIAGIENGIERIRNFVK